MTTATDLIQQRMEQEGLPKLAVDLFVEYVRRVEAGETGMIPEESVQPVESLPDAKDFGELERAAGLEALPFTLLLKLNGGLGTGMGLNKAKSLLVAKDGHTFLDLLARQVRALRGTHGIQLPLVLMNSFSTEEDSLEALQSDEAFMEGQGDIPLSFLQHKVPKLERDTLIPAEWPANPELTWCPPGHGDLYTALVTSGMLDRLLAAGYRYAFVSNSDNLGATLDVAILGHFAQTRSSMMMEAADRTEADRKGGHLARRADGSLLLRESAQCPEADMDTFQDVQRHRYFNSNSIWLNLEKVKSYLDAHEGKVLLPVILNRKTVDPRDETSTPVLQIETAMGSAIGVFPGATAVRIPKHRFAPVKTTDDLLVLRSDQYKLTEGGEVHPVLSSDQRTVVQLDKRFFKKIDDFEARFPEGPPSLLPCRRLIIEGDHILHASARLEGEVLLKNAGETPVEVR